MANYSNNGPPISMPLQPVISTTVATTTRAGTAFIDQVGSERDKLVIFLNNLIQNVDKKALVFGVSVATTLGLGGAAAWYFHQKRSLIKKKSNKVAFDVDGSVSPVTVRSSRTLNAEEGDTKQPEILMLHQCPRGRKTPCIAPYPLKLETFLRVNGIKYDVEISGSEPRSQGSPWITLDLEDISDTHNCLLNIISKYGVDGEPDYDEKDKGIARAYNHLLENHLYWGIALWRWVYDGAQSLGDIQMLSKKTLQVIPDVCRTVEQAAWFHGLGKKSHPEVIADVTEDIKALSDYLGTKQFFLGGDKATELDCTAFAMLAQMLWNMDGCPFNLTVKETYKNLSDFCWRMRVRYWPDWDNCLNNAEIPDTE